MSHRFHSDDNNIAGKEQTVLQFAGGPALRVADWNLTHCAPDENGAVFHELTGWLVEDDRGTAPYGEARLEHAELRGRAPLAGLDVDCRITSMTIPMDRGETLWDHPGLYLELRWQAAQLTPPAEAAPAAAAS
ncbi:hypothetical protein [Streptomyces sp. NPDC013489]|uniref:hypothetical protein n=1 Tax=Streptomyces sp. NPDC013489 TaxID=3155606 RepID=UPI0033E49F63